MQCDVTFHPGWYHRHAGVSFDARFFYDWAYRIEADRAMRRALYDHFGCVGLGERDPTPRPILGSDLLACGYLFSGMSGCEILFRDDGPPEVIASNASALCWDVHTALETHWWRETMAQAGAMERAFGYVLPAINLQGVQNIALDVRGADLFMDYVDEPEMADRLLSYCTSLLFTTGSILKTHSPHISGGVTGICTKLMPEVYLHSNCTVEMISQKHYVRYLLSHDVMLSLAFPPYGVHHCGQHMERYASAYANIPGLAFAEVGAGSDIAAVRTALGNPVHLNLRYSPVTLMRESPQAMRQTLLEMVEAAQPWEHTSISCVGLDGNTPDTQVLQFLSLAQSM